LKRKKIISTLIVVFFGIWFFQYFLSYIQGAYTIVVLLIGLCLWFILLGIAIYQLIKLAVEKIKNYQRLLFVSIILILGFLSYTEPMGMINWEKYEGQNILVAEREGTANCRTIIKLKENNKLKYISRCFGVDFHLGTYELRKDTLYFELEKNVGYMDKYSYATLLKSKTDTTKYKRMILHKNFEDKRSLSFSIKEIKMNKLLNKK